MRTIGCIIVRTEDRAIEETAREITAYLQGYTTKD
jgi:regulator of PEP synthase PpsR (kinase-PPPase family)